MKSGKRGFVLHPKPGQSQSPFVAEVTLSEGDLAPDFEAQTHLGETFRLSELRGRQVVLFFYPRDNTPGCTTEACAFRDLTEEFNRRGVALFGVSADDLRSHNKFATKYQLNFPLVMDHGSAVGTAYGAWGMKSFLGKKFMGMRRVTFLIDKEGRIKRIWSKVKPAVHAREVLTAVES